MLGRHGIWASEADKIAEAERAVLGELDLTVPVWKGTAAKGSILSATEVCVDRTYGPEGGVGGNGGNAGYVVVTFPRKAMSDPQDGKCEDAVPEAEKPKLPKVQVPASVKDESGLITRNDLGQEDWPLDVPYGIISCDHRIVADRHLDIAWFTAPDKKEYALNGAAKPYFDDLRPIWTDDPEIDGL